MGRAKQAMMEYEDKVNGVLAQLERAGAVRECECHGYPIDQDDNEAVETVREALIQKVGKEQADQLIEDAMAHAYMECPGCAQNAKDD